MSGPAEKVGDELHKIVGKVQVNDDLAVLGIEHGSAAWIVTPGSAAEVAELIGLAHVHDIAVVPVGAAARAPQSAELGDRMCLFVDTRRMNHVLHLDETSLMVHVQCGLKGLELESILARRGLSLGDYPRSALVSTIGGLLSVRTPGKSSARHGFVEDAVLGLSAVLADGRSIHTRVAPRRATGPDLARVLCGSEGTLGFITSAVLRIHRLPEARFLSAYVMPGFDDVLSAVNLALREEAAPSALRAFDCAEARAQLGVEVCESDEAVLVAATAGPTDLAACDRDLIASAATALGARPLDRSIAETWWARRMGQEKHPSPPLPDLQVTAPPSKQKAVYREVRAAVAAAGGVARAYASRFDYDGAVMFFSFSDPATGERPGGDTVVAIRAAAEAAAESAGAVLLGTANPALGSYILELRQVLDPRGIMNPGALRGLRG